MKIFARIEFSKLILATIYLTALSFTLVAAYMSFCGIDISSFSPIVLTIWAELATSSGFYYWKAKSENKIKLLMTTPPELVEAVKDLIDN